MEARNGPIEKPFCGLVACYFVRESLDLIFFFFLRILFPGVRNKYEKLKPVNFYGCKIVTAKN